MQASPTAPKALKLPRKNVARERVERGVVRLEYLNPDANLVYIAGSFNDWHPSVTEMVKTAGGHWRKELALPPGNYEYQFVVDGAWMTDPLCRATTANPFGGHNSVMTIPKLKS